LIRPASVLICDCGFNFASGDSIREADVEAERKKLSQLGGWLLCFTVGRMFGTLM
jgi:hypothetical protein